MQNTIFLALVSMRTYTTLAPVAALGTIHRTSENGRQI